MPFESNGFAPIDQRPGRLTFDAERSAGNPNDLRGKILRIHVEENIFDTGPAYTVPDGNLFPRGTLNTRPEIYVMGCRNPYRIAVDPATDIVYWGEVGPDSGTDGPPGPRGYDEFNQARQAGSFGWPFFVGNSKAYHQYDFATKAVGPLFDALGPTNNSPNNTGAKTLPPVQQAMVWYPYNQSDEFAELGKGGRCAIPTRCSCGCNTMSQVSISTTSNRTFFFADKTPLNYTVSVKDREDKVINKNRVRVALNYIPKVSGSSQEIGHQMVTGSYNLGKNLMAASDCKACHQVAAKSVGPAFVEVAKRYRGDAGAVTNLANKIIIGGGDVWGEHAMSAHPQVSREDAAEMVKYVLSLGNDQSDVRLPQAAISPNTWVSPKPGATC